MKRKLTDDVSRRDVLTRGAVATGVLITGGMAMGSAVAHGARGGSGFIIEHDYQDLADGDRFQITGVVPQGNPHYLLLTSPTCNGKAERKEYRGYRFVTENNEIGNIYLNPDREVSNGHGHWYELTQAHECGSGTTKDSDKDWPETRKVSYKPATGP